MPTLELVRSEKIKPQPNAAVVQILTEALSAANAGRIRNLAIAMVEDDMPVYRHGCEEGQEAALSVMCTQLAEELRYRLLGIEFE